LWLIEAAAAGTVRMRVKMAAAVELATKNCPVTATKVPAGGHENCPVAVMGSARM
jgi:hypothetical protein